MIVRISIQSATRLLSDTAGPEALDIDRHWKRVKVITVRKNDALGAESYGMELSANWGRFYYMLECDY